MRAVSDNLRNLLALRTEALRQFRIAFKANAPATVTDDLRNQANRLNIAIDRATRR
jgi:hypothetical protein